MISKPFKNYNLVVTSLLCMCITMYAHGATPEEEIRQAFEAYKLAAMSNNGLHAVEYLDSTTMAYYQNLLTQIRQADSATVDGLPLIDKAMVFAARHMIESDVLRQYSAKDLVVYFVDRGLVGRSSIEHVTAGEIQVHGNSAQMRMVSRGNPTSLTFSVHKENGGWKVDITTLFNGANAAFMTMVKTSGMAENAYLFSMLEIMTGKKPTLKVWQTLL